MSAYTLARHLAGQQLLDSFDFFYGVDPSKGFVNYQERDTALAQGLVSVNEDSGVVRLGVDSTRIYDVELDDGRPSVRLTSKESWNKGLFIADFSRMPSSACGSWPAFWALNNNGDWPVGGEIDIIEGQNGAQTNIFAAHTEAGCSLASEGFEGTSTRDDCGIDLFNRGCTVSATDDNSYGDTFNAIGGGVYAMEWTDDGIMIWHFARGNIPNDIRYRPLTKPDPSNWGAPQALFGGPAGSSCETNKFFYNMSLAINIDFCGDYAGTYWEQSSCSKTYNTSCKAFVANNPSAFENSAWEINYIDVWLRPDNSSTPTNSTLPPFPANGTTTNNTEPASTTSFMLVTLSTTDPTAMPTSANGGLIDDANIDGYTLLGCFGSTDGYTTFEPLADLPDMDNEACVEACKGASKKYAGTALTTCYCADTLGDASSTDNSRCSIPCPGCYLETCGGYVNGTGPVQISTDNGFNSTNPDNTTSVLPRSKFDRRAGPNDLLLTIYGNVTGDILPPPPGIGGDNGTDTGSANGTITTGATATVTTAITVTYTTICATNPAELVVIEYCTTLTIEDCPTAMPSLSGGESPSGGSSGSGLGPITPGNGVAVMTTPPIPMTTCVETCSACGENGQNTITLTIPAAVATGGPDVVVTALTVISVVPQINNGSESMAGNGSYTGNGSTPSPAQINVPVMAGADGVAGLVAWGVMLWLGVFGIAMLL
ncbi:hypothetical protein PFICI_04887 [Pestalotiopsis fici W106-1]|uniref:GH16 domain-containing protein n=1 Tax=Pestalotiopsis fici (strain W106-1 / CGMCC3.15140) TaxID=1229662 RepID=W3XCV0_PESFW|nr:uncharacterized protein PFICI_04887 [Pestalotiopsis fici W106-1]ETS83011.1 hypothetical protein PFICI_04887 [Pestalotiopsis fici W106-1]